ncbi:MAG: GTPase ObgE [Candidatus Muirbacterium halophilum]|nr:GTPase ObgE [Candidatus Muirbacterium halophilum]
MFLDYSKIYLQAGKGGNGCISILREKYVEKGGPNGGDGGNGGSIVFYATSKVSTLIKFRGRKHFKSSPGVNGRGSSQHGKRGIDLRIDVPVGTVIKNAETGKIIVDLDQDGKEFIVAHGGKGGRGNARFAKYNESVPLYAEKGTAGDTFWVELELKLLSDAAIIGYPNAGKSTLISVVSNAKPKIADYPFTTISPNLGVCSLDLRRSIVFSDIPGLIEGASENCGLGHRFLRHIERSKVLLHLVSGEDPEKIIENYKIIRNELVKYSTLLADRTEIIVVSKADILNDKQKDDITKMFEKEKLEFFFISAATNYGIKELLEKVWEEVEKEKTRLQIQKEKIEREYIPEFTIKLNEDKIFNIKKENGIYYVTGKKISDIIEKTSMGNERALEKMQDKLENIGVFKALKEYGVKEGDEIDISGIRFEYSE